MDSLRNLGVAAERCFAKMLGVYEMQPPETKDPVLAKLGKEYGLKFITDDQLDCADFSYDKPDQAQLDHARGIVVEEISLYPKEAIEKTRIEQVVLCTNLMTGKKRAGGTLKVGLHYVDTLFIDISSFSRNEMYGRRTLHHELFHAIDFRDTWNGFVDADWMKIQGEDFAYEFDAAAQMHRYMGRNPQEVQPREFDDPYKRMTVHESHTPGFITDYARYSTSEDKAEVFCYLMVSYAHVMERCEQDAILKRKVERMKELLHTYIPELDEAFWEQKIAHRSFPHHF